MKKVNRINSIRRLHYFEAVARLGSLSLAAVEFGITQSAISHQLRELSEELGEKLFVKSGRGIRLTETGKRMAEELTAAIARIESSVASVVGGGGGTTVRLAVCSSFAPGWLIPRLATLFDDVPPFDLQLRLYAADPDLTDKIADAFVTSFPEEPGFWSLPLRKELLVAVQSPQRGAKRLITTDLEPDRLGADWKDYCKLAQLDLEKLNRGPLLQCSHYMLALEMAKAGLGVALVPQFLAEREFAAGTLVALGTTLLPTGQDYYLCIKHTRRNEPALRFLAQWFRKQVARASTHGGATDRTFGRS